MKSMGQTKSNAQNIVLLGFVVLDEHSIDLIGATCGVEINDLSLVLL